MKTNLEALARLVRYYILCSTTQAGSGHPTSSLSATDLMTALMFGGFFSFDVKHPEKPNNDRLIFSKGHASPLFYSLWAAAGAISEKELMALRNFSSPLEGHPTMNFFYTEAATGSLGQGLSVGLGMALNAKYLDKLPYKTFVLLGDSEMAEGSIWEAIQLAAHYQLDNLIGILDVNRLGQRGETMYGHNTEEYEKRIKAFGWKALVIDGHNINNISEAYSAAREKKGMPVMIIAKTIKGKGVSFLENQDGWHGKVLKPDELKVAVEELGELDKNTRGEIKAPLNIKYQISNIKIENQNSKNEKLKTISYQLKTKVATRKAYGDALVSIFPKYPNMVVLDAEVSNSTHAEIFQKAYPDRFFEMFIAEQNMVGAAIGLARQGKIPFISTFAAFFTRAYDQIRMAQYSNANIKFVGSHCGVSIGEDGASQMGLEDIAMLRTLLGSVVLYPCDAVSTYKLVEEAAKHQGNVYLRTTRSQTPVIYKNEEEFLIGGCKVLRTSDKDLITVVAAGITVFEALQAYEELKKEGIHIRIIDLYSIKPLDGKTLRQAAEETKVMITVEDHYAEGGLGEAVQSALSGTKVHILAVRKMPRSGKPQELMEYEKISKNAIIEKVKKVLKI